MIAHYMPDGSLSNFLLFVCDGAVQRLADVPPAFPRKGAARIAHSASLKSDA